MNTNITRVIYIVNLNISVFSEIPLSLYFTNYYHYIHIVYYKQVI